MATVLYKPTSIRQPHGSGYVPAPQAHRFMIARYIGPRGGIGRWYITLPFGSQQSCTQGESERARQRRDAELADLILNYVAAGWTANLSDARRLSEVHAAARKSARPPAQYQQRDRARFRLRAADAAVAAAKRAVLADSTN